jgi:hypothetical protein
VRASVNTKPFIGRLILKFVKNKFKPRNLGCYKQSGNVTFDGPCKDTFSPTWHAKELAETERRLAQGKEQILDWETAKKKLRKQFE